MSWASMRDRMNRKAMRTLTDGPATYTDRHGSTTEGISIMIDFNVERTGPEGLYSTDQVGITFSRDSLSQSDRGGVFAIGCRRFMVEDEITDDGYWITVACTEQI